MAQRDRHRRCRARFAELDGARRSWRRGRSWWAANGATWCRNTPASACAGAVRSSDARRPGGAAGRRVVVLASGDPMCFGVGELLVRRFDLSELRVLPAPSAFSLVCARLGWPLAGVALSAHSRPLASVRRHIAPGARLLVLSRDGATADAIAPMLADGGFGPSLAGCSSIWTVPPSGGRRAPPHLASNVRAIEHRRHRVHRRPGSSGPGAHAGAARRRLRIRRHADQARGARRDARPPDAAAGQCLWDVGAAVARSPSNGCVQPRAPPPSRSSRTRRCAPRSRAMPSAWARPSSWCRAPRARLPGRPARTRCGVRRWRHRRARDARDLLADAARAGGWSRTWSRRGRAAAARLAGQHGGELLRIEVARLDPLGSYRTWRPSVAGDPARSAQAVTRGACSASGSGQAIPSC